MEFRFRAVDEQPPSFLLPPSANSSFSHQSLPASYSSFVPSPNTGLMGNLNYEREVILHVLEKEQIRRDIIAAEMARRKLLEDEVRRELMLERELALRRNMCAELSLEKQIAMRLSLSIPLMHLLNNLPFEEKMKFPGNSAMNVSPLPRLPQVMAPGIKLPPEINKDKFIILDKPDPDCYGAKWKALELPAIDGSEHYPLGLKKKPKDEWSCALCHVSATSEKGLNEHLQGRKHKAKEAALRIQKIGKSAGTSLLSKKSENSLKPTETILITTSELEAKADGQSIQSEVALEGITKKVHDKDLVEIKNEQLVQKKQNAEGLGVQKTNEFKRNKKVKFWCEVCQVGVPSQVVMEKHKNGRKHMARMLTFTKNKACVPVSSTVPSETTPLTKDADAVNVLIQETNMKMEDNFANSDKPSVSLNTGQMGNPSYKREAILLELEKEQIRQGIVASEIAQRRMLEDEVRRELAMMGEKLSLEKQIAMPLSPSFPMMHPLNNLSIEKRMAFPVNNVANMFPLPQLPQVMAPEIKPPAEINRDNFITLDKLGPDRYRAKRKALESAAVVGSEHSPFGLTKKPKDEWSCALCHVNTPSFKGLNGHLQGRKHKAKEAALRIQKIGKGQKADEQSLQSEVALEGITKKVHDKDVVEIIDKDQQKKQNAEGLGLGVKKANELKRKKKFKFWCEVCQVGLQSQVVMENHKNGRKHMARMLTFTKNEESVPVLSTVSSETTPVTKHADALNVLTKETTMEMGDNSDKPFSPVAKSSGDKAAEELRAHKLEGATSSGITRITD